MTLGGLDVQASAAVGAAWGLGGLGLALAVAVLALLRLGAARHLRGGALGTLVGSTLALCVGTAVWPAAGFGEPALTWAAWVRGVVGDLSATSVVLLLAALASVVAARPAGGARSPGLDGIVLRIGAAALGWTLIATHLFSDRVDLYSAGYANGPLLPVVLVLACAAALAGAWRCALSLAAALLASGLGLPESTNLWDALVDPWLTVWASASLVALGWRALRGRSSGPSRRG